MGEAMGDRSNCFGGIGSGRRDFSVSTSNPRNSSGRPECDPWDWVSGGHLLFRYCRVQNLCERPQIRWMVCHD